MDMGRAVLTRMGRRHLFLMGDLKKKDSGKYSVEIETDGGKVTKEFEISVPGTLLFILRDVLLTTHRVTWSKLS